jgi:hypothetical protein
VINDDISNSELRFGNSGGDRKYIVGIINIPGDVTMFHIVEYLNQKEIVSGLSETNN